MSSTRTFDFLKDFVVTMDEEPMHWDYENDLYPTAIITLTHRPTGYTYSHFAHLRFRHELPPQAFDPDYLNEALGDKVVYLLHGNGNRHGHYLGDYMVSGVRILYVPAGKGLGMGQAVNDIEVLPGCLLKQVADHDTRSQFIIADTTAPIGDFKRHYMLEFLPLPQKPKVSPGRGAMMTDHMEVDPYLGGPLNDMENFKEALQTRLYELQEEQFFLSPNNGQGVPSTCEVFMRNHPVYSSTPLITIA